MASYSVLKRVSGLSRVLFNFHENEILLHVRFYRRPVSRRPVRVIMPDGSVIDSSGRQKLKKQDEDRIVNSSSFPQHATTQGGIIYHPIPSQTESRKQYSQQNMITDSSEDQEMWPIETNVEIGGRLAESRSKLKKKEVIRVSWSKTPKKPKLSGVPEYLSLMGNNNEFSSAMLMLKSRKHREKTGKILLEGKRLITDAILAKLHLETVFFSLEKNIAGIPFPGKVEKIYKVMYKQMQLWSDLQTCPGVMAVFKTPSYVVPLEPVSLPLTIVCDNIREPGNLGAILRCAAAVGCEKVVLTKGCVDLWEPKVLRSGSGAHFRISVLKNIGWEYVCNYIPSESKVILADNRMAATDSHSMDATEENNTHEHAGSSDLSCEFDKDGNKIMVDSSYEDPEELKRCKHVKFSVKCYRDVDYTDTSSHIVLVVGGETEGLSAEAMKLAVDNFGERVIIPLKNGVDSLNAATALGVILFEIQRQFATRHKAQVQD